MEPSAPARVRYVGGPRDHREDTIDLPGGLPTIVPADDALGFYVRDTLMPDGRWRLVWRGFEEVAPNVGPSDGNPS